MSGGARKLVTTVPDTGVPALTAGSFEKHARWPVLQTVEVPLAVRVPLVRLTLREVRGLKPGVVLASEWPAAEEVPLYAADVVLSWCEFAVVDGIMAARLTRLG